MERKPTNPEGEESREEQSPADSDELSKALLDAFTNPEKIEARFQEIAEFGLKELEGLDDSQQVVLDDFPGEGKVYSVAEVKHLIATIRDKDNPFTYGFEKPFIILSTNPEEYFREIEEETNRRKQFSLKKLEPYADDQLLTYVHPNHYIDPFTGKAQYYQRTAKELRDWIKSMDYEEADQVLSHVGGIKVISSDPNISMEELEQRTEMNHRVFNAMVQQTVDKVNDDLLLREKLTKDLEGLPDEALISYPLGDGSQSPEMSVEKLKAVLGIKPKS